MDSQTSAPLRVGHTDWRFSEDWSVAACDCMSQKQRQVLEHGNHDSIETLPLNLCLLIVHLRCDCAMPSSWHHCLAECFAAMCNQASKGLSEMTGCILR